VTTQPLRLTEPGEQPAPRLDDQSAATVTEAVDTLARLRTPYWLGDNAVRLHALLSLIRQAEQLLPQAVADAREPRPDLEGDRPTAQHLTRRRRAPLPTQQVTNP
jgi:hypothetical protein